MAFPVLKRQIAYTTHRCWNVYTRRAQYLANQAWRDQYGQIDDATGEAWAAAQSVTFQLPDGKSMQLPEGWQQEMRDGERVFIAPDGRELSEAVAAAEAVRLANEAPTKGKVAGTSALRRLSNIVQEGHAADSDHEGHAGDRRSRGSHKPDTLN